MGIATPAHIGWTLTSCESVRYQIGHEGFSDTYMMRHCSEDRWVEEREAEDGKGGNRETRKKREEKKKTDTEKWKLRSKGGIKRGRPFEKKYNTDR